MKFLIIKLSSLGDVIHALPIVNVLRKNFPDAQIDWLVGKKGFELLSLIKEINNIYLLNFKNLFLIQKQKYDYVIDVQGLFKSALLSRSSLGKRIIGFKNTREFADIFYDEKINVGDLFNTKKHIVDLNLELISNIVQIKNLKTNFLIPNFSTLNQEPCSLIIFSASTWESKLWPMDYWYELIEKSYKVTKLQGYKVYICASNSDLKYIGKLIQKLDSNNINYVNLVGKTSIKDLICLIQKVGLVVGLDSFGVHLASAIKNDYGYPEVIGIYGPTSIYRTGPYGLIKNCLYLSKLECIACRKKTCPLGHHKCMNDISVDMVRELVYSLDLNCSGKPFSIHESFISGKI
ncbi:MAG: glycosyltransferase family 9 protein [Candidatus Melainabacteria bacterium]|nr:glycosyltransferase family 9 protein [Candidatus Melainabacteria bacterium]